MAKFGRTYIAIYFTYAILVVSAAALLYSFWGMGVALQEAIESVPKEQ